MIYYKLVVDLIVVYLFCGFGYALAIHSGKDDEEETMDWFENLSNFMIYWFSWLWLALFRISRGD